MPDSNTKQEPPRPVANSGIVSADPSKINIGGTPSVNLANAKPIGDLQANKYTPPANNKPSKNKNIVGTDPSTINIGNGGTASLPHMEVIGEIKATTPTPRKSSDISSDAIETAVRAAGGYINPKDSRNISYNMQQAYDMFSEKLEQQFPNATSSADVDYDFDAQDKYITLWINVNGANPKQICLDIEKSFPSLKYDPHAIEGNATACAFNWKF